jgi:hypothetical protein
MFKVTRGKKVETGRTVKEATEKLLSHYSKKKIMADYNYLLEDYELENVSYDETVENIVWELENFGWDETLEIECEEIV